MFPITSELNRTWPNSIRYHLVIEKKRACLWTGDGRQGGPLTYRGHDHWPLLQIQPDKRDHRTQQASKGPLHAAGDTQTRSNMGYRGEATQSALKHHPRETGAEQLVSTGVAKPVSNEGNSRHSSWNPQDIWTDKQGSQTGHDNMSESSADPNKAVVGRSCLQMRPEDMDQRPIPINIYPNSPWALSMLSQPYTVLFSCCSSALRLPLSPACQDLCSSSLVGLGTIKSGAGEPSVRLPWSVWHFMVSQG